MEAESPDLVLIRGEGGGVSSIILIASRSVLEHGSDLIDTGLDGDGLDLTDTGSGGDVAAPSNCLLQAACTDPTILRASW